MKIKSSLVQMEKRKNLIQIRSTYVEAMLSFNGSVDGSMLSHYCPVPRKFEIGVKN